MSLNIINGVLNVAKSELNLKTSLRGGMSFRWVQLAESEYRGVIGHRVYYFKQSPCDIEYKAYDKSEVSQSSVEKELNDYFRLDENLTELYEEWSSRDAKFKQRVATYPQLLAGIRVLRLDPVENLFSFICSSNNNIKRITQMVDNMCIHFGESIGQIDNLNFYSFPTIERLAQSDVEDKLRKLNFGYRAKFIHQAAVYLSKNFTRESLLAWRVDSYQQVVENLIKMPGIGKKVADCIALMSMDKLEAIPVDTHVFSLAKNMYNFLPPELVKNNKSKTLSDKNYKFIADKFRELWGSKAGWAQTIMFVDDLKNFDQEKSELKKEVLDVTSSEEKASNRKRLSSTNQITPAKSKKSKK